MMKIQRVERHLIKASNPYFEMLKDFCFKSKNLYNSANYQIRQKFINENIYLNYYDMDKLMKSLILEEGFVNDYKEMPTAKSAQQCLRLLDKNWKSFFKSIKDGERIKQNIKACLSFLNTKRNLA